jgi:membrane fusion protein, heavy metal efflux system
MQKPFIWKALGCVLVVLAAIAVGALGWSQLGERLSARFSPHSTLPSDASQEPVRHDEEGHADHIDLSSSAAASLGLRLERVTRQPFMERVHLPATVVEKPGQSGLSITSPIQGVVKEIHRLPGHALALGDLIFTMHVTDEALEAAQLALLDILTRLSVTEREIERLDPLTESGAVVGRRKLEMEYQLKQLQSEQSARLQELKLRGLSTEQIQQIVSSRTLINEIEVRLNVVAMPARPGESLRGAPMTMAGDNEARSLPPEQTAAGQIGRPPSHSTAATAGVSLWRELQPIYTVESLNVYPGMSVRKGDELCHVANHHELYLQGEAFPGDLASIREALQNSRTVLAEIGEGESRQRLDQLKIAYIDNHADPVSQTFPFYLTLPNEVVGEHRDAEGRQFLAWRFKPGQRAHVYVPVKEWPNQIVLPAEAVIRSGPEAYVFRLENLQVPEEADEDHIARRARRLRTWELAPVSVQILHRDRQWCVMAADQDLRIDDLVVVTQAYQLYLAWKIQMSSGEGGHSHDHDH